MKFKQVISAIAGEEVYIFQCPGCGCSHQVWVKGPTAWEWNGDVDKPTVNPSLLVQGGWRNLRCHSFIRDGMIQFLSDCSHSLAGQTVEIPDWA